MQELKQEVHSATCLNQHSQSLQQVTLWYLQPAQLTKTAISTKITHFKMCIVPNLAICCNQWCTACWQGTGEMILLEKSCEPVDGASSDSDCRIAVSSENQMWQPAGSISFVRGQMLEIKAIHCDEEPGRGLFTTALVSSVRICVFSKSCSNNAGSTVSISKPVQ
jgi:hypothetical protein